MNRKRIISIAIVALVLSAGIFNPGCRRGGNVQEEETAEVKDSVPAMGFWPDSLLCEVGRIRQGETFSGLMVRMVACYFSSTRNRKNRNVINRKSSFIFLYCSNIALLLI